MYSSLSTQLKAQYVLYVSSDALLMHSNASQKGK